MGWCRRAASSSIALCVAASAQVCHAGGPLGPNGTSIRSSQYALDLYTGPVLAGTRVTGLAGAYVAISEDVDGDLGNPAAPAVRPFFSYNQFDYWLGFGFTFPATLENTDFFNSGSKTRIANSPDSFVFFTPAVNVQWGELGIGATLEMQRYALSSEARAITVTIPTTHVQIAHGFDHNQWVFGLGVRFVWMAVDDPATKRIEFASNGTGIELGGVYKPENIPLRLGVAARTGIRTEASYRESLLPDQNGDLVVSGADGGPVYLPKAVAYPWDLNFGFAVQLGPRPFNPPWRTSAEIIERRTLLYRIRELDRRSVRKRELARATTSNERREVQQRFDREQADDDRAQDRELEEARAFIEAELTKMNRFYLQISGALLISGSVDEAVGVESLLTQIVNRSGERLVASSRLGVETGGFIPFLRLRGGTYVEPTRFDGSEARLHGTFGIDVKLIRWSVFGLWPYDYMWRLGLGADVARQYNTWGFTLAGWYPRHVEPSEGSPLTRSIGPAQGPPR